MQMNVAGIRRKLKNTAHNYSDAQIKVREATSNDPWGPSSTLMAEIADMTYNVVAFSEIMSMIWKRTNDHGKYWRHIYKALILLEYLIKTGSEKVAQQCKENIYAIQTLKEFQYYEEGKDQGVNIREKSKQLVALLKDDEKLKAERAKSLTAKERFTRSTAGFGSDPTLSRSEAPGRRVSSEIENVRPSTEDEEELQLQLALAMSKEEADNEEAKRRSDDVRLQLAISQSQQDFQNEQPKPKAPQSNLVDLLDIFDNSPAQASAAPVWGATADPWMKPASNPDPWASNTVSSVDSSPAHQAWGGASNNNNNIGWNSHSQPDPWLQKDPFKADPWNSGTQNGNAFKNTQNNNDIDLFAASSTSSPFKEQASPQKANPHSFLGEGAGLVNLDYLMKPAPAPASAMPSTNPFADAGLFQTPLSRLQDTPPPTLGPPSTTVPQFTLNQPFSNNNASYHFEYNNNNNNVDELIVTTTHPQGANNTGNHQSNMYPNLSSNSGARKGLFVE